MERSASRTCGLVPTRFPRRSQSATSMAQLVTETFQESSAPTRLPTSRSARVFWPNNTSSANCFDGKDTNGSLGGTVTNDAFAAIRLSSGAAGANYNFGELLPASIGGCVYVDSNLDGVKDPGEKTLAGVLITLTGTDDLGQS